MTLKVPAQETPAQDASMRRVNDQSHTLLHVLRTLAVLFKARVVSLLIVASIGGAFLGAQGFPAIDKLLLILLTGSLAAGGASAINQYIERHNDAKMRRTGKRPLVNGELNPHMVLFVACTMIAIAVLGTLPFYPAMSLYLFAGALIYVGVYTIWLKPRSIVNIVIGGAAGSCAVMTGGAAVGAASDPAVISLALLVFLWTPAHFWALALFYRDDYKAGAIPMLPAITSEQSTAWWVLVHAFATGISALLLAFSPSLNWLYTSVAVIAALFLFVSSIRLVQKPERPRAIRFFVITNFFLLIIFIAVMLSSVLAA